MVVPRLARAGGHLDETDAFFHQAARHQAAQAVGAGLRVIHAIQLLGGVGFFRNVQHFARRQLHARGEFKVANAGF